jgi:hypothetical protein
MKKVIFGIIVIIVIAVGYWLISPFFINVRVSESLPVELIRKVENTSVSTSNLIQRQGNFVGFDKVHNGSGTVSIYNLTDSNGNERKLLRFEEGFQVNNGPDLYVGFGKNGEYVKGSEIARLKGNIGAQNYEIPADFNIDGYDSVYVWCKAFSIPFIKADLR